MKISTRGRYALRVMIDLAEHNSTQYVRLKEISDRQRISLKYLESIMALLTKSKLVEGLAGKGGGYRLYRPAHEYTVGEILRLTEGSLAPVPCVDVCELPCANANGCRTRPMWEKLSVLINDYLDGITVADLVGHEAASDFYVI